MTEREVNALCDQYCTRCERKLNPNNIAMLELDQRTNTYHDFDDVPPEYSQGWFPFGVNCAAREIHKAKRARKANP